MLDTTDRKILRYLQRHGRCSNSELAIAVGRSESACLRRVRQLEDAGVIRGYSAQLDPRAAGFPLIVFVYIALDHQRAADLDAFEVAVTGIAAVTECYLMTGEFDYVLKCVAADAADFERVHKEQLTQLPGVTRIQSSIALRVVADSRGLPLR
ncbi:MAG: Lrp/AsnC family transcriptional regulator [Steroidobacteraceae bacterium]